MWEALLGVYLVNAVLLIVHEIDSAYWKEWRLFGLGGGIDCFLLVHLPLMGIVVYGLALVARASYDGLFYSLLMSLAGIAAFVLHDGFRRRGHKEFDTTISQLILIGTLVASALQGLFTLILLFSA